MFFVIGGVIQVWGNMQGCLQKFWITEIIICWLDWLTVERILWKWWKGTLFKTHTQNTLFKLGWVIRPYIPFVLLVSLIICKTCTYALLHYDRLHFPHQYQILVLMRMFYNILVKSSLHILRISIYIQVSAPNKHQFLTLH